MKRQGGFTLIELVVVIVILGILAVTAAPRFLNLQSDARASSLQGLKGAMAGSTGIVYGKAAIDGLETQETVTKANNPAGIALAFGYPDESTDGIEIAVDGLGGTDGDWEKISGGVSTDGVDYTFKGQSTTGYGNDTGCHVNYIQAASSTAAPTIRVVDDKC
ncbi:type II secretion system protein [Vibrio maerlii]|uniref:type II secretion system protein n=1 Tax=Vibrio maerlii TaxID=2231648 RepID=UPI000E3D1A78|nr:type II secretion system protein [Vibrio maerlii]